MTGADAAGTDDVTEPAEVEALPLPLRAEAYLAAQQRLQDRLELGGP